MKHTLRHSLLLAARGLLAAACLLATGFTPATGLAQAHATCPADSLFHGTPYLLRMSHQGVTVMFHTRSSCHTWVEYGTDSLHLHRARQLDGGQEVTSSLLHAVRLDSLTAGQPFVYRVCATEIKQNQAYSKRFGRTARTRFYTSRLPQSGAHTWRAVVVNDLHNVQQTVDAMAALADSLQPDFTIVNGDCLSEPASPADALHKLQQLTQAFRAAEVPMVVVRGNHEIRNAYADGLLPMLDLQGNRTYGAFTWGDTRFVLLDCGEDKPDSHWVYYGLNDFSRFRQEQLRFLQEELKSRAFRRAKCRLLIHHIPIWGGDTDEYNPCLKLWGETLRRAPFNLEVCAHTHRYAFHEAQAAGNPYPLVVGGGYDLQEATLLVLERSPKGLTLRVLDATGRTLLLREGL